MNNPKPITAEYVRELAKQEILSTVKPVQVEDDLEFLNEPREETRKLSNGQIKNTRTGYVEEPLTRKLDEFDRPLGSNI